MTREAVLVSNGPGELYTWALPVLRALRQQCPDWKLSISLIPCQFASGKETSIAQTFEADNVTTPRDFLRLAAGGKLPTGLGADEGVLISLGGNTNMAIKLADKLGYPTYRYSFVPYWNAKLRRLFVHDARAAKKARLLGAPKDRLEIIGNLVADAVELTEPADNPGKPHVLLLCGSRDLFARHVIPLMIALADRLGEQFPEARFVWPVSRMLSDEALADGIAGKFRSALHGSSGVRQGDVVITPNGYRLELIPEASRYAHMRAADLAITIPGTNTLELGIAGVPSIVLLPLNKPEIIPLEGPGHWLSLIPLAGTFLKRHAVKLAAPHFPVALPNSFSGEPLMLEIKGEVHPDDVVEQAAALLTNAKELARRRERLNATMPPPGAADKLVTRVLSELENAHA